MDSMTPLPIEEIKCLKIVRITGLEWNFFTGYLPYLRILNKNYDYTKGDLLDEKIIEAIRKSYPNSVLSDNRLLFFKGELEKRLKAIQGGSQKKITINFFPQIDYDYEKLHQLIKQEFSAYLKDFTLRIQLSSQSDKLNYIHDPDLCYIPYEQLDVLIKTIETV